MTNDPDSPRVLALMRTEIDAQFLIDHLRSLGIWSMNGGAGTSTGWPEAHGDVQVLVRQSDLQRAQQVRDELARTNPQVR
ncbi:MAG: hypothetical protein U0992_24075 [Planctomycetaceae bacterium]